MHRVEVWTIPLDKGFELHLNEAESERALRLRFDADRERWSRARTALRVVLGSYLACDPQAIEFDVGPHGKPTARGAHAVEFNLSHAGEWALVAVSKVVAVGVDIERVREKLDMRPLLKRLGESDLPETRADLYQRWTTREARSKAAGGALFDALPAGIQACALTAPEGYAASVALVGATPDVHYCDWGSL